MPYSIPKDRFEFVFRPQDKFYVILFYLGAKPNRAPEDVKLKVILSEISPNRATEYKF